MSLEAKLNHRSDQECFEVRWKLKCFRTGLEIGREADLQHWSASIRKVSVMMALFALSNRGKVSLSQEFVYTEELGRGVQSGTFQFMSPGFTFTLRDAMANMISTSDNVCTGQIFHALGRDDEERVQAVNDYCRAIGMRGTVHRFTFQNTKLNKWHHSDEAMTVTTMADQVKLLTWIVDGSRSEAAAKRLGVTAAQCREALDYMKEEFGISGMGALLPEGAFIGCKAGRDVRGRSHIGVIYEGQEPLFAMAVSTDWVPTVLLDGMPGSARATELISELVQIAWNALSTPAKAAA